MSQNGTSGNSADSELKVIDGSELGGAAVKMDEDGKARKDRAEAITGVNGEVEYKTTADPAQAQVETAQPEHKKQLRDRVEARRKELETAQAQLKANHGTAPAEKVLAIETALQGLETHVGGGWDKVGEVESQQLAQWLESTQFVGVLAAKEQTFTPPSDLKATADQIGATGVLDGPPLGLPLPEPAR